MTSITPALNQMGTRIKTVGTGWLLLVLAIGLQALYEPAALPDRITSLGGSFASTAPFLLLAVVFAAYGLSLIHI